MTQHPLARRLRDALLLAVGSCSASAILAGTQLPMVCTAGSCGPKGPASFVGSGQAGATYVGNTLTVQQTSEQAVLNWASFNVSADGKVLFKQPNGQAIALNEIFQASPSQIFGLIQANGQVYLVNQNGIVFGPTAQVNVGGLLASTLQLTSPLSAGLLAPLQQNSMPALASDGRTSVLDASGNPVLGADGQPLPLQILVQPGAQIAADSGGRVFLAGQSVINGGSISAPNGQVILAAGKAVYIEASNDPTLRGLIVEVDAGTGSGLVDNQVQGSISVAEGNVTLVGLAVNQLGRISATTSVSEGGSIRLVARDSVSVVPQSGAIVALPTRGGTLTLGPQSTTSIMPDLQSTATAIDEQGQPRSALTLAGKQIELQGGSILQAPDGQVAITAASNPSVANSSAQPDPAAHLRIDSGALIDVSGSTATVPVTQNLVAVQLRGSELADSPVQRDSALRGQTVIVDARVGTPLANVSGDLALIQRGVLQRTDQGGSIVLDSGGDVVVSQGATLNVSGGQVNYTPGIMQTSLLIEPNGASVDIGSASPTQIYTGVFNPVFKSVSNQWGVISFIPTQGIAHLDPGYTQGASAGSIQVLGSSLVLNGEFLGSAVNGIYQRSSGIASGGTFTIGLNAASSAALDFRAPAVELVSQAPPVAIPPDASLPPGTPLELPTQLLTSGGFTHLQIFSNDRITVPSSVPPLDLAPGGSVTFMAPLVNLDTSIRAPGGSIQLTSTNSFDAPAGAGGLGVFVGEGLSLDVSGQWVNDLLVPLNITPSGLAMINAGSVSLDQTAATGTLSVASGTALLANGGAWYQRGAALSSGRGGSISLVGAPGGTVQVGTGDTVEAFGVQGAPGGTFTLEVPRLKIGAAGGPWLPPQSVDSDPNAPGFFELGSALFSSFGFSAFSLTADGPRQAAGTTQDILTIAPNAGIDLRTPTLVLDAGAQQQPTGASLRSFSTATLLPEFQRTPSQLTLRAAPGGITQDQIGTFTVSQGASITADPGSTITLASVGSLLFDGSIRAPSSNVNLGILAPAESFDPGFVSDLRIELQPQASIDVSGTVIYTPQKNITTLSGSVLPGGAVTLNAARGTVLTDAGSLIDFSGTQAPMDLPSGGPTGPQQQIVASAAGSLAIDSPQSISLLGGFLGQPGTGTTGRAAGGTLDLTLSRLGNPASGSTDPLTIVVQPQAPSSALASNSATAVVGVSALLAAGVDALNLASDELVELTNGVQLDLARSVTITAPAIAVASQAPVAIHAPYVALGAGSSLGGAEPALPGQGSIVVGASEIDLIGALAFQGVGQATLTSSGDILLRGELNDPSNLGSLAIAGDLTLSAQRVVPTSLVNFSITASGGRDNTVQFEQNGPSPGVPLSAAGSLSVEAQDIIQGGTIFAPFGQLSFSASNSLSFMPGSLTSVSGTSSVIPFGEVLNGTSWVYQVTTNASEPFPQPVTSLPLRQISISGSKVTLAASSTLDVSGGGDLTAYQWTPGTGGTTDVLSNTVTPGLYAVLPSLAGQTAPYDPMMWAGSNLAPNQSVYLSAGSGLAAGIYPLLPARYALLPGAFLVTEVSGTQDQPPGVIGHTGIGAPIVSGYFTFGTTGIGNTRTDGFLVEPGSYAMTLANYQNNLASAFFATAAATSPGSSSTVPAAGIPSSPLPADGGILTINVQTAFDALGKVNAAAAPGGTAATIELIASQIEVDPTSTVAGTNPGFIHVSSGVLDSWNAGRLWLGLEGAGNGSFDVATSSLVIASGSSLAAGEVVLAATGAISIEPGASISSLPPAAGTTPAAASAPPVELPLNGSAAGASILIASDLNYWIPVRGAASSTATNATLNIAPGASVSSQGSLTVDSLAGGTLGDGALSGAGAQWSLASTSLVFGAAGSASTGFALDASLVAALQAARTVRLSSANPIEISEPVTLGSSSGAPSINEIDIVSPGLHGNGNAPSSFSASLITLSNPFGAGSTPQPGTNNLSFSAQEVDVGPGALTLSGFAQTTIDAANAVVGMGAGSLSTAGDLKLLTPLLTAVSDAQTLFNVGGALTLAPSSRPSSTAAPLTPGGSISLSAATIADSTRIAMPSGEVSLAASEQLTLASGAVIDVSGAQPSGAPHGADAGTISLISGGDIAVNSGALLSVQAAPGANAGSISVLAAGSADIEAALEGSASAGYRSGSFVVQAQSLPNFPSLNSALENAGFHQSRVIEVGSGDLDLAAGGLITANTVVLTADSGSISVAGSIAAPGSTSAGTIDLSAHGALDIAGSASLSAGASAAGAGGHIELASVAGNVQVDPASSLAAAGAGSSGTLVVRAPRLPGNDVAIASLPSDLSRMGSVVLEPILSDTLASSPTAADFSAIESSAATFMAAASPNIESRLGLGSTPNVVLRPYLDLTASGDLTLPSVNFASWRFAGQPADISIRSSGSLTVAGTLTDGFTMSRGYLDVITGPSARISLVAGANLSSASATSVAAGSAADLDLAAGAIVRTGTGDLTLAAARDINFGNGASIYTGGQQGAPSNPNTDTGAPISFPTNGGNIYVTTGRDINGAPVTEPVDQWNVRLQSNPNNFSSPAIWGIDFQGFQWNIGALGGGNVDITAGRNTLNLTAAVADSRTFTPNGLTSLAFGGGNLKISTGADLDSGLFFVGKGIGTIDAGGALGSAYSLSGTPVGTVLLAGDASFSISAGRDVLLNGMLAQTALATGSNSDLVLYLRYDPNSALSVQSRGGSIAYNTNPGLLVNALGNLAVFQTDSSSFLAAPPTVDFAAYGRDINVLSEIAMLPSPVGQLSLYAARDITSPNSLVLMSDQALSSFPTADAPSLLNTVTNFNGSSYTSALLHQNDPLPVIISAGRDISNIEFNLPKPAEITAGRDIGSITLAGQNLNPNDITLLEAGRNIAYTTSDGSRQIAVTGPGQLELIAGGTIDFGVTAGVTTYGNLVNSKLPSAGASVSILAGLGPTLELGGPQGTAGFVSNIIAPSPQYQQLLIDYIEQLSGKSSLSFSAASQSFQQLTLPQQLPLIEKVYFDELVLSGEEANQVPSLGFGRGYAAIDALFPGSRGTSSVYAGDVTLGYSRIYTLDGGSISMLVPGGAIDVGLANPPTDLGISRAPASLGIVTIASGDVNIYSLQSIAVDESRVFTLGGGNIAIWSTLGNIDAGNGAKTSISVSGPGISVDANGNVSLNFTGAVAGSGIRTIESEPDVPPGNVSLIAPVGFVNAGDAGIGSSGNINIAAQRVIGATNINFGGTATGVPPEVSGIGAALSGASSVANSATTVAANSAESEAAQQTAAAPLASAEMSWLEVFVEGFGEEVCKSDDIECLKRNRKP